VPGLNSTFIKNSPCEITGINSFPINLVENIDTTKIRNTNNMIVFLRLKEISCNLLYPVKNLSYILSTGLKTIFKSLLNLSLAFSRLRAEFSIGTRVRETTKEASREKVTVSAISLNSCPAIPSTKTIGKNTATVVKVEAVTAPATSEVPFKAELYRSAPFSLYR